MLSTKVIGYTNIVTQEQGVDISASSVVRHFSTISGIGNLGATPADGFTRAAWSKEEAAFIDYIKMQAEDAGLITAYDALGNFYVTLQGRTDEVIMTGSHSDTVVCGGNFDGVAGIVLGLEALIAIKNSGVELQKSLRLVAWRGEESATFGIPYIGSQGAFGQPFVNDDGERVDVLSKTYSNVQGKIRLRDAIVQRGFDPTVLEHTRATLDADRIAGYVELHIEQANKLEKAGCDIGVVTSIRGSRRRRISVEALPAGDELQRYMEGMGGEFFKVSLVGEARHSGGTEMGPRYRKDANLAMSYMLTSLDELARAYVTRGTSVLQTVSGVNTDPFGGPQDPRVSAENGLTKVSGFGHFTLGVLSSDLAFRESYVNEAFRIIDGIAVQKGVRSMIEHIDRKMPEHSAAARSVPQEVFQRYYETCEANIALARFQVELDELVQGMLSTGADLVHTVGVFNSDHGFNKDHPQVFDVLPHRKSLFSYCAFDVRSNDALVHDRFMAQVQEVVSRACARYGLRSLRDENLSSAFPVKALDVHIRGLIADSAEVFGYTYMELPSGSGHDAAVVAKQVRSDGTHIPTGMIFIPCKDGLSHCKEEFTSLGSLVKGGNVLVRTLLKLSR